ncbi:MAG: ribosome-associated translation inhibitor RaiA [Clostridia bacterium]|nr:ribosome-associated translation inhibitor RaiA [Clostridia bacterium]
MKITFVCRQITVKDDLKVLVDKKLSRLDKYFDREGDATVTFSKKRNREVLEITISAANTLFRSEVEDESFQNALDRSIDNIERQIRKNKTRLAKRLRAGVFAEEPSYIPPEEPEEDTEFIIRTKSFQLKPMSAEEAILQMNLLGHQFFMFEDQDSGETCLVYTRKDGAYGLIVAEKK